MTATSPGPSLRTRFFVRRSSFAAPLNSTKVKVLLTLHGGQELLTAEHTLQLLAPVGFAERFDTRVCRVSGHLFDPEMTLRAARDLRQVGDRQHLRPAREALERLAHRVCGLPADTGVDLVEDHRLAAADRRDCQRDAGELA